ILVFGDQTEKILPAIQELYRHAPNSLYLRRFLQVSHDVARRYFESLSALQSQRRYFDTFLSLADESAQQKHPDIIIQSMLHCVAQLGTLVMYDKARVACIRSRSAIMVGWCTGLLPAAVAASAVSMVQVLELAPRVVELSIKIGVDARCKAAAVEDHPGSWARVVKGCPETELEAMLNQFNATNNLPAARAAYISTVGSSSCTISGPPSTLETLFSSTLSNSRQFPSVSLPLSAPFHGSHLPDLGVWDSGRWEKQFGNATMLRDKAAIISPSSGRTYVGTTLNEMLPQIVDDILWKQIRQQDAFTGIRLLCGDSHVSITPIVATAVSKQLEDHLCKHGVTVDSQPFANPESTPSNSNSVAIVGMSGRFPGAESLDDFWRVLEAGIDLCREIPQERFDVKSHHDPTGKKDNTTLARFGCFIDRPGMFDARLFNMSPREAASTDPGQRLLLMTTYEALEMAGYTQEPQAAERDTKVGSFFGQTIDDWREYNAAEKVDMYYVTGGIRAFSAGRVNYHFKWDGPSYSVDSACSSSLLAIQLACSSLQSRECNMAVAGGSNILTGCNMYSGLSRGSFLSQTGSCKTFDSGADGYCRGEGVGVVVLKRLDDALANRDPVLAVIKSAATNHSAQAVSITHPHVETQERLFRDVLAQGGVNPTQVDYVECHGTGTQAGDAAESSSVVNVLARGNRERPLVIGSLKPNIGHGEAAAGVSSLIKTLLMMRNQAIPPHIGVKAQLNPNLPSFEDNNYELATSGPFAKESGRTRKIMINNFSAAGGNTSLLIEDAPSVLPAPESLDPRTTHVITVSGKTPASLQQNLERLSGFVASTSCSISSIAYTSTARRMHHPLRKAYVARTPAELSAALERDRPSWEDISAGSNKPPTVVFAFPGQGSKILGAGAELYKTSPACRREFNGMDALCASQGVPSFLPTLLGETSDPSPLENQLTLAVVEVVLARLWQSWGVKPDLVIGHSLGEYAALCVAGVISASDMVYLISKRAELMMTLCAAGTRKMLSLRLGVEDVEAALRQSSDDFPSLQVACINGPTSTVVSGLEDDILRFQKLQQEDQGVTAVLLEVPYAFHSAQMDPILEPYEKEARSVHFATPTIPVASTLLGSIVREPGVFSASYLARQARQPVRYTQALDASSASELIGNKTLWLEIGPGTTCMSFVKQTLGCSPSCTLPTLDLKKGTWETASSTLAAAYTNGVNIRWTEFHYAYRHSLSVVSLPTYAFDLKNYWLDYTSRLDHPSSAASSKPTLEEAPAFTSRCWQQIGEESFTPTEARVKFTSDFSHPELHAMARGHMVGGVGLCPSSLYSSMAYSAALYIFQRRDASLSSVPPMDIFDMEIFSPCIVSAAAESHPFTITAIQALPSGAVELIFASCPDGDSYRQHAKCSVLRGAESMFSEANKNLYLIRDRISTMRRMEQAEELDRLSKSTVYKLFKTVVDYSRPYQALESLHLNPERPESFAKLSFPSPDDPENFVHNPFWIDNLAQLGGFSLNVSPPSGQDDVYISHGWQSMRILRRLTAAEQLSAYVCMQPSLDESGVWSGDVYVFTNEELVAMCSGLKFKQMRRTVLFSLLGAAVPNTVASMSKSRSRSSSSSVSVHRGRVSAHRVEIEDAALSTILEAAGLRMADLSDGLAEWSDLGIDSLLTITILQQLRESTGMDLPSSLFSTYPTVESLRTFFRSSPAFNEKTKSRSSTLASVATVDSGISMSYNDNGASDKLCEVLASIIAREVSVGREEILPTTQFSDLGMDSLLTITILASFREEAGVSLPSSFFNDCPTLRDVEVAMRPSQARTKEAELKPLQLEKNPMILGRVPDHEFTSTAVLLQGTPKPGRQSLFLLPDGSGSALSYIDLPPLTGKATSLPVYALNSPFIRDPDSYTLPFEAVAEIFIKSIRSTQPHGPYLLAGWSMGGIFAYEVSRQLLAAGEVIELLCLIDSPCPRTLPPLPAPTLDILDKAGLFSGLDKTDRGVSTATRKHFLASVRTLEHFHPAETPRDAALGKVVIIWAKDGVLDRVVDEDKKRAVLSDDEIAGAARDWLVGKRSDFGPAGWDRLVGREVECRCVPGDHFSIVKAPLV
ncbi:PKS16 protein, partial [Dactylonectria macrodidyma]